LYIADRYFDCLGATTGIPILSLRGVHRMEITERVAGVEAVMVSRAMTVETAVSRIHRREDVLREEKRNWVRSCSPMKE